ncbi:MAG: YjiH family protein [Peptoniphilus sp.]|nr:YjiH family protein [Peptoniphilus sp.]
MNKERVNYTSSDVTKFILFAAFGIFMFFVPISIGGKSSIPIDHIVTLVKKIPNYGPIYAGTIVIVGAVLPFIRKTWNKTTTDTIFALINLLGIPFVIMAILNKGPEFLMAKDVIPFIYNSIVITVTTVVPIGSVFLAFLVNFGLMEFVGILMQPVMKPIWKTPGRSAIDAVASFVGSYSLALLITDKVYQDGKYTGKEAAIIATGFSTVSATFMIVVARTLDIMDKWLLYFWLTLIITFIVTAITARIYPLSKKPDTYYGGQEGNPEEVSTGNRLDTAVQEGMRAFKSAPTVAQSIKGNFINGINLALTIGPSLMAIGTLGIVIANHTPVFDIIGYVFYPFTMLTRVPEPLLAAKAMALSIAEMFLPALLVPDADIITKFLIAVASVSEILFFSASIPCIMGTKIPLKMSDYIIIWIERVILTIVITVPILHFIF